MTTRKKGRKGLIVLVILLIGSLATLAWARKEGFVGGSASKAVRGEAVRRGPLSITVVERGNLEAAQSVSLTNELEGRTTILHLIPEGTRVKPGDLLCELDTSSLIDKRVQQEIQVQNADAAYVKSKQNYEIQKSQNESEVASAERALDFAQQDLEKYIEGDWPQQKRAAEEDILVATEELKRAQQDLEWSKKLAAKGFLEQTQLDADQLAETRADIKLNQAKRALELLEQYTNPRQKKEYEADVEEKGRELTRAKLEAEAHILDVQAALRTDKAKLDLEKNELEDLVTQIDKARIVAPVPGMVVYYKEQRGRFGSDDPIQEGTEVRERQILITIPSSDRMIAKVSLHESVLEKVDVGMPCRVRVDAIPGKVFDGKVKSKSVLPDQNSWWANPDLREYKTEVEIAQSDPAMRPGMSCSIEILSENIDDAVYVPVQSVFLDGGDTIAFVQEDGKFVRRPVEVGPNDGKVVVVNKGLEEGEIVALSTPAGFTLHPVAETGRSSDWNPEQDMPGPPGGAMPQGSDQGGPADAASMRDRMRGGYPGGAGPGDGGGRLSGDTSDGGPMAGRRRPGAEGEGGGRQGRGGRGSFGSGRPDRMRGRNGEGGGSDGGLAGRDGGDAPAKSPQTAETGGEGKSSGQE